MFDADDSNTKVSPALIAALHPWALSAFDETAEAYRFIIKELGQGEVENETDRKLRELAKTNGLSDEDLLVRLKAKTAGDIKGAEDLWLRLGTRRTIKIVVLGCQRYWSWGAADLFRLRITSAQGYLRLQAEAVALIALFLEDDGLAERWSTLHGKEEGRKFFRDTQSRVKETLAGFDLANVYDIASSGSQHVRMTSFVRSLNSADGKLSLPDQEFDREDAFSFHLAIAHFHRIQGRVLAALGSLLFPGNSEWKTVESTFQAHSGDMWATVDALYKKQLSNGDELDA